MEDSSFEERTTVNPLTASTWNQNANYNTECPALGCSANGGRAWVGCVPVATGQIMRFYQYPTSLNWAEMPLTNSTPTTAALLRDIGNRLQTTYGCDASSTTNANIKGTLASYGYPMPSDGNYNFWTVASEIQNGRPVILGGYHDTQWWIFGTQNGHTWVADGLILSRYYSCSPDPNTPGEWVAVDQGYSALLYMNWGWGGTANAWYSANNFNPSGYTYNVQPFQVVNIRKP
ncbi:MAG: C10 family peptidase [Chryseolinea sp.]